ncbi:MAG TPA: tetratricopeptide repeat protein [Myxococcales bacterium]|nr:tetratricopeptide repeat protein [Myxococcales bacterium]
MKDRTLLAALGAALLLASAGQAAEEPVSKQAATSAANLEEARQHAAKAKVHYDLGEFDKAAEEYILVYRLRPLPALLFNIAQSYRQAGQYEKAKQFYKAYLRENPDPQSSAAVKKALKEIDELLAKERKTKESPPAGIREAPAEVAAAGRAAVPVAPPASAAAAPSPGSQAAPAAGAASTAVPAAGAAATQAVPAGTALAQPKPVQAPASALPAPAVTASREAPSSSRRTWTYVLAGTSVAMLAGGALFAVKAKNVDNELLAGPHSTATADDLMSQSKSAHGASTLLLLAGVAAGAGAGVLYFWPTSSGAAVAGRF